MIWVFPKIGVKPRKWMKMDGENSGKSYEQMDDLGGSSHPYFWFNTHIKMVDLWKAIALQEPKKLEVVIALGFFGRWKVILHVGWYRRL